MATSSWRGTRLGPDDSLIISDGCGSLEATEAEDLLAWVEQGDHLIYHLDNPFLDLGRIETDPILLHLGLELGETASAWLGPAPLATTAPHTPQATHYPLMPTPAPACYGSANSLTISLPEQELPLQVDLGPGRALLFNDDSQPPLWRGRLLTARRAGNGRGIYSARGAFTCSTR